MGTKEFPWETVHEIFVYCREVGYLERGEIMFKACDWSFKLTFSSHNLFYSLYFPHWWTVRGADLLNSSLWVIVLKNYLTLSTSQQCCVCTYSDTSPDDSTSAAWNTSRGCVWRRWIVHHRAESPGALRNSSLEPELHLTSHSSVRPKRPSRTDHTDKALISAGSSGRLDALSVDCLAIKRNEQKWRNAQDFGYPSSTSSVYTKKKKTRFQSFRL